MMNTQATPPLSLDFGLGEYTARLKTVQDRLTASKADLLLIDQIDHMAYLFGYLPTAARYQAALIPSQGEPYLIVRELDVGTFLDQSWARNYEIFADDEDSVVKVADAIRRLAPSRLAVEKDSNILTVSRLEEIKKTNPSVEIVDFSGILWELRLIKSPAELDYIRRAAEMADSTIEAGIGAIHRGVADHDALSAMYASCIRAGADNTRNALIGRLGYGESQLLHANGNKWATGERVFLEATPQYRGYSARAIRSVLVGTPSSKELDAAKRVIEIQNQQIEAIRPGALAAEVDAICRRQLVEEGLRAPFSQATAYTLGYQAVPRGSDHTRIIAMNQDWRFEKGMVFHMAVSTQTFAISETVTVTASGAQRLTILDRRLYSTD
jgi:Xaa-Pro aminopeptidase